MWCFLDAVEAATISPRSLAKQLNLGNTAVLERRIKRELEEHGMSYLVVFMDCMLVIANWGLCFSLLSWRPI